MKTHRELTAVSGNRRVFVFRLESKEDTRFQVITETTDSKPSDVECDYFYGVAEALSHAMYFLNDSEAWEKAMQNRLNTSD